jgi:hypothetical protein
MSYVRDRLNIVAVTGTVSVRGRDVAVGGGGARDLPGDVNVCGGRVAGITLAGGAVPDGAVSDGTAYGGTVSGEIISNRTGSGGAIWGAAAAGMTVVGLRAVRTVGLRDLDRAGVVSVGGTTVAAGDCAGDADGGTAAAKWASAQNDGAAPRVNMVGEEPVMMKPSVAPSFAESV